MRRRRRRCCVIITLHQSWSLATYIELGALKKLGDLTGYVSRLVRYDAQHAKKYRRHYKSCTFEAHPLVECWMKTFYQTVAPRRFRKASVIKWKLCVLCSSAAAAAPPTARRAVASAWQQQTVSACCAMLFLDAFSLGLLECNFGFRSKFTSSKESSFMKACDELKRNRLLWTFGGYNLGHRSKKIEQARCFTRVVLSTGWDFAGIQKYNLGHRSKKIE